MSQVHAYDQIVNQNALGSQKHTKYTGIQPGGQETHTQNTPQPLKARENEPLGPQTHTYNNPCSKLPELHVEDGKQFAEIYNDILLSEWQTDNELDSPSLHETLLSHPQDTKHNINDIRFLNDLIIAHKVIKSGVPNKLGCMIPVNSTWNIPLFRSLLGDYHDIDVVNWLEFGFSISYEASMNPRPNKNNHKGAVDFPVHIDEYLHKEIEMGAIMGPFSIPPFVNRIGISPMSSRPKKDSMDRRIILDLSFPPGFSVNDGISAEFYCGEFMNLKYPNIDTMAQRIMELGPGCKIWKIDMSRYFRQLPLCPGDYSLIGVRWKGLLYFDKSVPMGLRSAAYCAQRVSSAIVYIHVNMGYWSTNYLDDFGGAENDSKAWRSFLALRELLKSLGAAEAVNKAVPPTTRMDFLGNTFDTIKFTIEVSENRKRELIEILDSWTQKIDYSKKELQSLIGKLSFITNCVCAGRIFLCRLLQCLRDMKNTNRQKVEAELLKDIKWWQTFLPTFQGSDILWLQDCKAIDRNLATDASLTGAGGKCNNEVFHARFLAELLAEITHISQLELITVVIAVTLWKSKLKGKVVRLSVDNMACVHVINAGNSKDKIMLRYLRQLAWVCAENSILVKAVHIPTQLIQFQISFPDGITVEE